MSCSSHNFSRARLNVIFVQREQEYTRLGFETSFTFYVYDFYHYNGREGFNKKTFICMEFFLKFLPPIPCLWKKNIYFQAKQGVINEKLKSSHFYMN